MPAFQTGKEADHQQKLKELEAEIQEMHNNILDTDLQKGRQQNQEGRNKNIDSLTKINGELVRKVNEL